MSAYRTCATWAVGMSLALLAHGEGATATPESSGKEAEGARAAVPLPGDQRRVYLFALPADATVFIDDADTATERRNGLIELTGRLKQTHLVTVYRGGLEKTAEVVIEGSGAVPPLVDLYVNPRPAAPRPPKAGREALLPASPLDVVPTLELLVPLPRQAEACDCSQSQPWSAASERVLGALSPGGTLPELRVVPPLPCGDSSATGGVDLAPARELLAPAQELLAPAR